MEESKGGIEEGKKLRKKLRKKERKKKKKRREGGRGRKEGKEGRRKGERKVTIKRKMGRGRKRSERIEGKEEGRRECGAAKGTDSTCKNKKTLPEGITSQTIRQTHSPRSEAFHTQFISFTYLQLLVPWMQCRVAQDYSN